MDVVQAYTDLFVHRLDRWGRQQDDGSYLSIRQPVTKQVIAAQVGGRLTAGWYQLRPEDDTAIWACLDADADDGLTQVQWAAAYVSEFGIEMAVEDSRRGAHGWLFFDRPLRAAGVKKVLERLMAHLGLDDVETFPKQGRLNGDGCGSLVRGPLGVHRKSGQASSWKRLPIRWTRSGIWPGFARRAPMTCEPSGVLCPGRRACILYHSPKAMVAGVGMATATAMASSAASTRPFLRNMGRHQASSANTWPWTIRAEGLCPWHDDEVASFRVNDRTGRWICFACPPLPGSRSDWCTGDCFEFIVHHLCGDDKRRAVRELAKRRNCLRAL